MSTKAECICMYVVQTVVDADAGAIYIPGVPLWFGISCYCMLWLSHNSGSLAYAALAFMYT